MAELFKTVLILSLFGFGLIALLLCLKPITVKRFPAKWQYGVWIVVMLSMLIPVYKCIPEQNVQKLPIAAQTQTATQAGTISPATEDILTQPETPFIYREINLRPGVCFRLLDLLTGLWLIGLCIFALSVAVSYALYLFAKKRQAVIIEQNEVLSQVKEELHIKRAISVKMSPDVQSPLLVGLFRPVVYLPCRHIPEEQMAMVLRHELMHYKRKDLFIKWLALFVNAVHWFNPLAYLLCANISESCEVSCDMAVTKNMSDEQQKLYMQTILDLAR